MIEINQTAMIGALVFNPDLLPSIRTAVRPEIWATKAQRFIVKAILRLFDKNGVPPRRETLLHVVNQSIDRADLRDEVYRVVHSVYAGSIEEARGTYSDEVLKKVQILARVDAANKYLELVSEGEFDKADAIVDRAKHVGVASSRGYNLLDDENIEAVCDPDQAAYNRKGIIKTGYDRLDKSLRGGVGYPELHLIVGKSGDGKSRLANNISANWVNAGLKTIYFSMEMDEPVVASRTWQILSGLSIEQLKTPEGKRELYECKKRIVDRGGFFEVKRFPEYAVSCDDLEAYVLQFGVQYDGMIIDYLDLMNNVPAQKSDNEWTLEGRKFAEARRLAGKLGTACITLAQPKNVEGRLTMETVRGAYGKIDCLDSAWFINATDEDQDRCEFDLDCGKNRYNSKSASIRMSYNGDTMRVSEMERAY